jgi:hypothetical protein
MESAFTFQGSREGSYFMRGETWEWASERRARRRNARTEETRLHRLPRFILDPGFKFEPPSLSILGLLPTNKNLMGHG